MMKKTANVRENINAIIALCVSEIDGIQVGNG